MFKINIWLSSPPHMVKHYITSFIDFFYPPFRRLMPVATFRYAACGGFNVMLDITLFFIFYNYIFQKQIVQLGLLAFQPHIAAFLFSFIFTFPIGFLLSRYIVWRESTVRGRIQLFRYFTILVINILLNYVFIKLFVEYLYIYPTVAKMLTTIILVIFSYLMQRHYTFKVKHLKPHHKPL